MGPIPWFFSVKYDTVGIPNSEVIIELGFLSFSLRCLIFACLWQDRGRGRKGHHANSMHYIILFRGPDKGWKADHTRNTGRSLLKIISITYLPMRDLCSMSKFFFSQQKDKQKGSVLVIHWYEALLIKANSILKWAKYLANMGFLWRKVKWGHFRKRSDGPRCVEKKGWEEMPRASAWQ